jgi:hypothetical protein
MEETQDKIGMIGLIVLCVLATLSIVYEAIMQL